MGWLARLFGARGRNPPPIDPAWLVKDDELYARVAAFLERPMPSLAEAEAFMGRRRDDEVDQAGLPGGSRDLGFGAGYFGAALHGGTAGVRFEVVSFDEKIARLRTFVTWSHGGSDDRIEALRRACGDRFTIRGEAPGRVGANERRDDKVVAALHAARAAVLGPMGAPDVPAALREAFEELTHLGPGIIEVGAVGVAARPARNPMKGFHEARRVDLLRVILRGPCPEGRVQAASSLVTAFSQELDDRDRAAIRAIRAQTIPIMMMSGCIPMPQHAATLIPAPPRE